MTSGSSTVYLARTNILLNLLFWSSEDIHTSTGSSRCYQRDTTLHELKFDLHKYELPGQTFAVKFLLQKFDQVGEIFAAEFYSSFF